MTAIVPNTLEDADLVGGYVDIFFIKRTLEEIASAYGLPVYSFDDAGFTLDACSALLDGVLLDGALMIVFVRCRLSQTGLLSVAAKQAQPRHYGRILQFLIAELQLKAGEWTLDPEAFPDGQGPTVTSTPG